MSFTESGNYFELGDKVIIYMKDNSTNIMDACLIGFDCMAMEKIINGIVKAVNEGEPLESTKQNVSVSELDEEYKLLYLKILCNYAYIGDGIIDSNEYAAIQNIVVRIGLCSNVRIELRNYMSDIENKEKTGDLLYKLRNGLDFGSYDIVRYSLMQDILYLHELVHGNESWTEDGFVGSLLNFMHIQPEQLELMIYAINLNRQMIEDKSDIVDLQGKAQNMLKRALEQRIPLMTLYCSGSVYSVDTYRKIFNGKDKANFSIDKQRELMLQTVIKNTQETVNHLVADMNNISEQLVSEIQKGIESTAKIKKLSALLVRLSKGAEVSVAKSEYTEQRVLYGKVPSVLNMEKIEKIRMEKKCELEYQKIMKYYRYDDKIKKVIINQNISNIELNELIDIFREIGY